MYNKLFVPLQHSVEMVYFYVIIYKRRNPLKISGFQRFLAEKEGGSE